MYITSHLMISNLKFRLLLFKFLVNKTTYVCLQHLYLFLYFELDKSIST